MRLQAIHELGSDADHRVEGVHRPLRYQGDLRQPPPAHLLLGEVEEVSSVQEDAPGDDLAGRLDEAHHRQSDG
jgi:hypothetical protein